MILIALNRTRHTKVIIEFVFESLHSVNRYIDFFLKYVRVTFSCV